ncbi:phenylacetate-CoA oxygenase/reductase subunit PaaK [soil metagenome]
MRFHQLLVSEVERLTEDSVAIGFEVPPELREEYRFAPGQHLTLRRDENGQEVRRSYSICASPGSGRLRVAVKMVEAGVFSSYANDGLQPGDVLDVMTPAGRFTTAVDPDRSRHYAAIAAGSGITPILSLVTAILEVESGSRVTLVYGNRRTSSIMFLEELQDLKNVHSGRLHLINVLSREVPEVELFHGRIDRDKLTRLFDTVLPPSTVDEWFLCGPFEMVLAARALLVEREVPESAIHLELFHVEEAPRTRVERPVGQTARPEDLSKVTVILGGRAASFDLERDTDAILDAALAVRTDLPFACKGGVCGTCRSRLVSGEVEMERNYALEREEIDAGIVLACQSRPLTPEVTIDFDV